MKATLLVLGCFLTPALCAQAQILSQFGAEGTPSQRFSSQDTPREIIVINGQTYSIPAGTAAQIRENQRSKQTNAVTATQQIDSVSRNRSKGAVDPSTGQYYPSVNSGILDPKTGHVYPAVPAGYIDPQTGRFFPKH